MASKEMAIFHKSQWLKGSFLGSEATDNNRLVNRLKVLNDSSFSEPVSSDWVENNLLDLYSSIDIEGNKINLKVLKESSEKTFTEEEFSVVESSFIKNGIPEELDYISLEFDWKALKTNYEEKAYIEFKNSLNSTHRIILTNKSKIRLFTTDGEMQTEQDVVDSSPESIGSISSFITNDLTDWFVDLRLDYDENESAYYIETRLRSSGYESIWYRSLFGTEKINKIRFIQKANPNLNSVVEKELNIKEIYVEGFETGLSYESDIFDGGENQTIWESFTIDGRFPEESLIDDGSNALELRLYASDSREGLKADETRSYSIIPTEEEFNIITELEEANEKLKGRYLLVEIAPSKSKNYQNSIDYFKVEYIEPSSLSDYVQKEVTEALTSKVVGPGGGVVSLSTEYFPVNLYIPEGALTTEETITIRRVASAESIFADDIIGFEFGPEGLEFLKPAVLEVDYSSFNFNSYQSEEGLRLAYLDNIEPEELETVIDTNRNKAISYVEHFSMYGIMATDNLYSSRTKIAASKLPRWMKVREKDSNFQKILNHGFFSELDYAGKMYYKVLKNYFLETADTKMKYIAFKTKIKNFLNGSEYPIIGSSEEYVAKYKGRYIPITFDERKFYNSKEELCYLDLSSEVIYFLQDYDMELKIINKYNSNIYSLKKELIEHKIWNVFDEFALLFDIERNKREDNQSLKERILDYGINPGDSTEEGLRNHIARELSLKKEDVRVNSLSDKNYMEELKFADGSATDRLLSISNYINNHLNIYWDQWVWDEGYWNVEGGSYDFIY